MNQLNASNCKRYIHRLLAVLMALALILSLAACRTDDNDSTPGQTDPDNMNVPSDTNAENPTDPELISVRFLLDWTPNTNHTGVYAAHELGYYREAGLAVEIIQPAENSALSLVAAGRADFCVTFQEEIAAALTTANPLPVTAVAALLQHNTSGIISLAERGIKAPADMPGHSYATWDTPIEKAILRAIIEDDGGIYEDVEMIPNTVLDVVSALQTDIDMVWIYYAWDGIATELAGLETNFIDFGKTNPALDFYTPVLAASTGFLTDNEDTAKRFLLATARGYQFAMEQPEKAAEYLLRHAPELDPELVQASQTWLSDQYMADAKTWGWIDPVRWDRFFTWMHENHLIERPLASGEGFTNAYLDPA